MPHYRFTALDRSGSPVSGEVVAESERAAVGRVKEMGHFPTEIRSLDDPAQPSTLERPPHTPRRFQLFGGVGTQDLMVFSRQLANLVNGGLPVLRSLEALIEHTENDRLREALLAVHDGVKGGASLHESLEAHPGVFPALYTSMVRAGESSGQLGTVLGWLAQFQEKEQAQRSQVRAALMYPMLLVGVGSIAVFLLLTFLVPRFAALFQEFDQALPLPTVVLMNVSELLARGWWALLLGLLLLRWGFRKYQTTAGGKYRVDAIRLRMPVWGPLVRKMAVARFARTLATLLRGGAPILEALEVVRDVLGNERMARAVDEVQNRVREGESLAEECRRTGFFPALLTHMIALGEETGDLQGVLETVADAYDVEVDSSLKGLVSLLEPSIILVMGLIVGFVVAAMLLPIFQMNLLTGL